MLELYAHPFSSYCWKALTALYEREIPFEYRMLERGHADNFVALKGYWPVDRFPVLVEDGWAVGDAFTMADYTAASSLYYADWVQEIGAGRPRLAAYRARLLARPSVRRVVDDARPYRSYFPPGAPERD